MELSMLRLSSSMNSYIEKINLISNNISNADTVGYKKDIYQSQSFDNILSDKIEDLLSNTSNSAESMIGSIPGVFTSDIKTIFTQGIISEAQDDSYIALSGEGFIETENDSNETFYTRGGKLVIDQEGYLATEEGYRVKGQNGFIKVEKEGYKIDENGQVSIDDKEIDKIKMIDFIDSDLLTKYKNGLYTNSFSNNIKEADCSVEQGKIENSNVDIGSEYLELISVYRNFETNQKVIQMVDEVQEMTVNEIGRV